jgi:hypothetical protein
MVLINNNNKNMKSNQEILDEFGKLVVNSILDRYYLGIKKTIEQGYKNPTMLKYNQLFNSINKNEKELLCAFVTENINSLLFDFLNLFEENPKFKLIYEDNGQQVDLVKISEMLKAEPLSEDGWIARFSKFKNNDD